MATRRSTRRSLALETNLDQENGASSRATASTRAQGGKSKSEVVPAKATTTHQWKRSAFTDVSNVRGSKSGAASTSAGAAKPAGKSAATTSAADAAPKPKTYRTRSSGAGLKEEKTVDEKLARPLRSKSANLPSTNAAGQSKAGAKPTVALRPVVEKKKLSPHRKASKRSTVDADTEDEEAHRHKRTRTSEAKAVSVPADEIVEEWDDLDEGDEEDPLMVSTYVVEIYDYLRRLEVKTLPDPDYMSKQGEVTWKMRGILIDWLIEIHSKFRLLPETIFLAVNIVDRFLSLRSVSLVKFQLVGIASLFIAAKYEEVVCPSISNFLYMTDGGYDEDEMLRAERYILQQLDFNMSYPNPINFLRRISKADGYDIASRTMAKYLMEISTVDHHLLGHAPSVIAAAGVWLARKVLDKGPWDANLKHYSGYSEEQLKPTAQLMLDYVVRNSDLALDAEDDEDNPLKLDTEVSEHEHPNFVKKYSAKKFYKAFCTVRQWAEEEYAFSKDYSEELRKWVLNPAVL